MILYFLATNQNNYRNNFINDIATEILKYINRTAGKFLLGKSKITYSEQKMNSRNTPIKYVCRDFTK